MDSTPLLLHTCFMAGHYRNFKHFTLVVLALGATFLFQNCDSPFSGLSEKSRGKPANNGQGYTGKAYFNIAKDGSCGVPEAVRSAIEKVGDSFYQTVKDCKPQSPVDVSASVGVQSYNLNMLIFSSALFESLDQKQNIYSGVACRGQGLMSVDGSQDEIQHPFADVSMQPTGQIESPSGFPLYKGYVRTGSYDSSGNLIMAEEYEIAKAVEIVGPAAQRQFLIDNGDPGRGSSLVIPNARPDVGTFQFLPPGYAGALVVQPMFCFYH